MSTKKPSSSGGKAKPDQTLRFAHPFFQAAKPADRKPVPGQGVRMLGHIEDKLSAIPPVRGDSKMTLADIIGKPGADAIEASGEISIHIGGDSGVPETDHETKQVLVADQMAKDYDPKHPETSPALLVHLGDVIYGSDPNAYLSEFYRPYMHYPGKIIAIPGNHDGETAPKIADFQKYFCAKSQTVPPIAGSIFRQTMDQPGVYWLLDAPFLQIVGLYSNSAENPGFISGGNAGQAQKTWLVKTLKALKAQRSTSPRKALLFATHHPPYSSGGHSGSAQMLADIDDACTQAGILPDAFFSGHAHSIQVYTRTVGAKKIPYIVSGCLGHGGQVVQAAGKSPSPQVSYDFAYKGWGYSKVRVVGKTVTITFYGVDGTERTKLAKTVTVSLT